MADSDPNPNIQWAEIFVDELARCGLKGVCIAPGSRSTPLTLAFDAHPLIRVHPHLDERSAAFLGLGMALAQDMPVALVCTSGTASANFHPAIIEAYHSQVPLLVLTADRPPELRHSGANQTIDQVKMYGDHVLWSVDMALPQADAPSVAIRNLRTVAARAYAKANGQTKGPVHLNFPFRKPLEPEIKESREQKKANIGEQSPAAKYQIPFARFSRGVLSPTRTQTSALVELIEKLERGLIVCGPRCSGGDFPEMASALSQVSGYPIIADPLSGLRFGSQVENTTIVGGYDTFLTGRYHAWEKVQVVIRFGNVPTSKALNTYLDSINPAHRIHVSHSGVWADDTHRVRDYLQADPAITCREMVSLLAKRNESSWGAHARMTEAACWQAMEEALSDRYFDGAIVADLVAGLPPDALLFAGNSLSVRHLDQFGRPRAISVRVFANRGASGIDGNISTALGINVATESPLVALVGDISFYHDLNGLLAVKECGLNLTIVLVNNNGGGIFHRLPIANHEPPFTDLFVTPHGLDFEPVARMYGLDFVSVEDRSSFQQIFAESVADPMPRVIEVKTDSARDHIRRQEVMAFVDGRVSESLKNSAFS